MLLTIFFILSTVWADAQKLPVMVSILPQKYFVQQVGKELVEVKVMVSPGSNPATYEPSPQKMVALSKSELYFSIGVPFEKAWLERFKSANPGISIIPTQSGINKKPISAHSSFMGEEQKAKSEHKKPKKHAVQDPHIWLDPDLVKIQAQNILKGLIKKDPRHTEDYKENYQSFIRQLDDLDNRLKEIFSSIPADKRRFMVFHPSWGYFASAYGLTQIAIEVKGKEPSPKELMHLITFARQKDIQVIFIQPQFSQKSARAIARQLKAKVLTLDPLAPNWKDNLLKVAETFENILH
jgi:zinc transport system substrate-binding protein